MIKNNKKLNVFEDKCEKLKAYYIENKKLPAQNSGSLGMWVNTQKVFFIKNKLSQERINLLLKITPEFFEDSFYKAWKKKYEEVKTYFNENKNLPAINSETLGMWIYRQKIYYNKKQLSQEKINLLLEITPSFFENILDKRWDKNYNKLKTFFQENKKLPAVNSGNLGMWVYKQKISFIENKLSKERIDLLLGITSDVFNNKLTNKEIKKKALEIFYELRERIKMNQEYTDWLAFQIKNFDVNIKNETQINKSKT